MPYKDAYFELITTLIYGRIKTLQEDLYFHTLMCPPVNMRHIYGRMKMRGIDLGDIIKCLDTIIEDEELVFHRNLSKRGRNESFKHIIVKYKEVILTFHYGMKKGGHMWFFGSVMNPNETDLDSIYEDREKVLRIDYDLS